MTIIEEPKTIEEETMQEFEPITKDNIKEVLEYNGLKYDGKKYNNYKSTEDGFIIDCNISLDISLGNDFKYMVQKRIELKPLPKKPEFDFKQYLFNDGFAYYDVEDFVHCWNDKFSIRIHCEYARTEENADILIAAAKLLKELK